MVKKKRNVKRRVLVPAKVEITPGGKIRVFVSAKAARRLKKNPASVEYKVARIPGYRSYAIYRKDEKPSTKNWVAGPFKTKKEATKRLENW